MVVRSIDVPRVGAERDHQSLGVITCLVSRLSTLVHPRADGSVPALAGSRAAAGLRSPGLCSRRWSCSSRAVRRRRSPCQKPRRVRERAGRQARQPSGTSPARAIPTIQGFATDISVDQGETVDFKIDTDATDYRLDIYRMGYYGGDGARKVATVQPRAAPAADPARLPDRRRDRAVDCGNWAVSASWTVPADAVSGIYFAKLVREDATGGASHIVFVVRDDDGGSDLLFQTSDTTWQAYNQYGGNSLYTAVRPDRPRLQGQLQPAVHDARDRDRGLGLQRRVPDGALARAQRLRRQLHHRRRHRPPRRRDPRAQGLPVGRPRRVLVGRPARRTSRPRATPASTWRSSAATRSSGRRAGSRASTASGDRPPHARLLQGDARRTPRSTRTPDVWTGHLARPARVQPAGRRRPAGERADRHDLHGQLAAPRRSRCRRPTARCASGATRPSPTSRRADGDARRRHARLRVGRGPRQRLPARRASSAVSTTRRTGVERLQDYGSTYAPGRRPTT